jgi:hypothetical protein
MCALANVLMRLYPIDKSLVCLQSERRTHVRINHKILFYVLLSFRFSTRESIISSALFIFFCVLSILPHQTITTERLYFIVDTHVKSSKNQEHQYCRIKVGQYEKKSVLTDFDT